MLFNSNAKSIPLNITKVLESYSPEILSISSIELAEEEKYINLLREQRFKIEEFQQEAHKKDIKIRELEHQLQKFQFKPHTQEIDYLKAELKEKEANNLSLQLQIKRQVQEFESSLTVIQNRIQKSSEDNTWEVKSLKQKLQESEKKLKVFEEENSNLKNIIKENSEELEKCKEKSEELQNMIMEWNDVESELNERVQELIEENENLKEKIQKSFRAEKNTGPDLKLKLAQQEQELSLCKKSHTEFVNRTDIEIKSLQNELQRAINVVSRQENTIKTLRQLKIGDDSTITNLSGELETYKAQPIKQRSKENKENSKNQLTTLNTENKKLKQKLSEMQEKDMKSKQERKKLVTLKLQMLSQRNLEVSKLADALNKAM